MVTLIFIFDPRSGQVQVKKIKFRNSKISFQIMPILSSFVSRFQKCRLFWRATIIDAKKITVQKLTSSRLPGFWPIAKPEMKRLAWILLHGCWYIFVYYIFRFLDIFKTFDFVAIYFWKKSKFWFLVVKNQKIVKIRYSHFVDRSIWHLHAFFACVLLQDCTF